MAFPDLSPAHRGRFGVRARFRELAPSSRTIDDGLAPLQLPPHPPPARSTTNIVAEAPIAATGTTINAASGQTLKDAVVATFTDADAALGASAFSATIQWGDGQSSAGTIVKNKAGGFSVEGSHRYAAPGAFAVSVQIRQGKAGTPSQFFTKSDLISDGAVAADHVDPDLVNPWGLVAGPGGPFWSSNNGTGSSSLFDGAGNVSQGLPVVTVPAPAGSPAGTTSAPTGIVFNGSSNFVVSLTTNGVTTSGPAAFIFSTEDGTISGWNPGVSPTGSSPSVQAILEVDNSASGAVYKGLTSVTMPATGGALPAGTYLLATDFHNGKLDAFDSGFHPVSLPAGAFNDATLPAGYAPFGIQSVGNDVIVTYAKQDADRHDDVAGAGNGAVDVYSQSDALLMRLGGPGSQPESNSPWGVVQAPTSFGPFGGDILVGNFGDSHVSAFDPTTGAFLGPLSDANGRPLTLDGGIEGLDTKGLWGLSFGNGKGSGPTSTLFFNSGFNDEQDGLFGSLTASSAATGSASSTASVEPSTMHGYAAAAAQVPTFMAPGEAAGDGMTPELAVRWRGHRS